MQKKSICSSRKHIGSLANNTFADELEFYDNFPIKELANNRNITKTIKILVL
jgi:hypothetical protein